MMQVRTLSPTTAGFGLVKKYLKKIQQPWESLQAGGLREILLGWTRTTLHLHAKKWAGFRGAESLGEPLPPSSSSNVNQPRTGPKTGSSR